MKLLTPNKFDELLKRGYSLDHICLLKFVEEGIDVSELKSGNVKVATLFQSLIRKGLLFETEDKLTLLGKELLVFMNSKESKKIPKKMTNTDDFILWWSTYPGTDTFEYKGKKFTGSRSLRAAKDDCRTLFNKILIEGEYSAIQLIEALKLDIHQKMEKSYQMSTNKLSFMQNSATYLRQRSFEPFIELIKSGTNIEESPKLNGTDI